ncbi:MAG: thiamine pyrophosphate-binding protein [Proteobacteria bacterium]|nr:thiamine pyrophosphate-binding protein [Pseudomonadota bacterium]
MAGLRGEQMIARGFQREGVDAIFYMMGGPTSGTAAACIELGMREVYVRHEQGAAMMAHAYARVTGKPGICITPAGPGTANAVTGLANAWADASPIVAIGGSAPIRGATLGSFQEMDQLAMMRPVVKAAYRVEHVSQIPLLVSLAFREALDGKRGPVYLDLPGDVLSAEVDEANIDWPSDYRVESRPSGDTAEIERAVEILAQARRPIVITGSGVLWSQASPELRAFVERTGLPLWTTPQGRGVVPEDDPRLFPAARSLAFREADVVLVIGARSNSMLSFLRPPRFAEDAKFIVVNIDGTEIGHNRGVELGIVGDAKRVIEQLTEAAAGQIELDAGHDWVCRLQEKEKANRERSAPLLHSDSLPIHPLRLCHELNQILPRDAILVTDGHEILNFGRQSIPVYSPGSSLNAGPHGCMGIGVPFGIGAQVAAPDKRVVVLSGVGAFGWKGMEMDSAIRHELPIVVVVSNNAGFTSRRTGGSVGRELGHQRYDKLVEALGGYGEFVEKPAEIRPAIERALASGRPSLVNVCTDPDAFATTDMGFSGY